MKDLKSWFCFLAILASLEGSGQVEDGQLDLSKNFNYVVDLSGEWKFYPNTLEPSEIDFGVVTFLQVPGFWKLGEKYKGFGYGLYHLKLNGSKQKFMAIRLERVHTSYQIWINDQLIGQSGQPGKHENQAIPGIYNQPFVFEVPDDDFDLFIGVSNFQHARGGMLKSAQIGKAEHIVSKWTKTVVIEVFLITMVIAITLYSLVMYALSRKHLQYLYFGLFCLFSLFRITSIGTLPIGIIFPETPYATIAIFRYAGIFISAAFIGLYIGELLPSMKNHWLVKMMIVVGVFCTVGVIVSPSWWGTYYSLIFQFFSLVGFAGFYVLLISEIRNGRRDLILVALSITCIVVSFVHDVLAFAYLVPTHFWQIYGFTLAAIIQTIYFALDDRTLHAKINSLYHKLVSLGLIHKQRNQYEADMLTELKDRAGRTSGEGHFAEELIEKMRNKPIVPVSQKVTMDNMEMINQDFFYELNRKFPKLTQADQELCIAIKTKLSTKEIATSRNISPASVRKAKFRLRKKLDLDKHTDLYQFFENI